MITVRERMDILSAYREVGSYRGAADICGTTPKTVKRAVLADAAKNDAAAVEVVAHNYDDVRDVVAERVAKTHGRITAKRLLPVAVAAGYDGSDRNFRRLVADGEAQVAPVEPPWPPARRVVTGRHARHRLGRDRAAVGVLRGARLEPLAVRVLRRQPARRHDVHRARRRVSKRSAVSPPPCCRTAWGA